MLVKTNQETKEVLEVKDRGVKAHFRNHKTKYMVGISMFSLGTACYYLGMSHKDSNGSVKEMIIKNVIAKEFTVEQIDNSVNTIIQGVGRNGHPGVVVYCPQLKKVFRSFGEAAKATGISKSRVSDIANGRSGSSKGLTFDILGDAQESKLSKK